MATYSHYCTTGRHTHSAFRLDLEGLMYMTACQRIILIDTTLTATYGDWALRGTLQPAPQHVTCLACLACDAS